MIDLQFQQTVVQILIYIQKEIRFPTIHNQCQITILQLIHLINNRMVIPHLSVFFDCSQLLGHQPILRKRTDIDSTTGTTCCTEHIFMPDGIPKCSMPAHTKPGNGASTTIGYRFIMFVYVIDHF